MQHKYITVLGLQRTLQCATHVHYSFGAAKDAAVCSTRTCVKSLKLPTFFIYNNTLFLIHVLLHTLNNVVTVVSISVYRNELSSLSY